MARHVLAVLEGNSRQGAQGVEIGASRRRRFRTPQTGQVVA